MGQPLPQAAKAALRVGLHHHQAGRLREAEIAYRDARRAAPADPDLLHLCGLVAYQLGRAGDAIGLIGQAIAIRPDAAFHDNLGLALRAVGRIEDAVQAHRRAAARDRDNPGTHFNLGAALAALGRPKDAILPLRRALAMNPNFAEALSVLGQCHALAGEGEMAISLLRRAVAARPGFAEAHLNLANALRAAGRAGDAIAHLEEARRLDPRNMDARRNLSVVHLARGDAAKALAEAEAAEALDARDAETAFLMAEALKRLGRAAEAESAYALAAERAPGLAEAHHNLGNLLMERGALAQAEAAYRAALEARADFAPAMVGLGRRAQAAGRFDDAAQWYRRALEADPHETHARANLAAMGRLDSSDGELARLRESLARPDLDPVARAGAHFTLARLHDRRGETEPAFEHWRAANDLQGRESRFDPDAFLAETAAIAATFDGAFFAERAGMGDPSDAPVFIVGPPRSGTTLAEQILASHPDVAAGGERAHLEDLAREAERRLAGHGAFPGSMRAFARDLAAAFARRYLDAGPQAGGAVRRITDKLPGNFLNLWLAALLFPNARVVHCVRDPMDVVLSCYAQDFGRKVAFSCDLGHIGAYLRGYRSLMAHWRAALPLPIHDFVYEDVVADQDRASRALLAFCGLTWDARCLAFHETERPILTASSWQARQPLYASSVGRWRAYARQLEPLRETLGLG